MNSLLSLLATLLLLIPQQSKEGQAVGAGVAPPRAANQDASAPVLRLASFNVQNLFDNYDDPYHSDEGTSPKSVYEILRLAKTIDGLDADVLALQEVENRGILKRLNLLLAKPFPYVELIEGNDARGIDVGLMSRFPVVRSMSHRQRRLEGKFGISRDLVVFELDTGKGGHLLVCPVHLKSKRSSKGDPGSELRRSAEARGILQLLGELRAHAWKAPFVTLGDFNDFPDSKALSPLFERLQDALKGVPAGANYSYIYDGKKQRIDHLLYDGDLRVVGATFVHEDDLPSDHHPFVVKFAWGAKPERQAGPKHRNRFASIHRPRIEATDLRRLRQELLQEVEIEGTLARIDKTRNGGHLQLRFAQDPKLGVTVFLSGHDRGRFAGIEELVGKKLLIRGPLFRYRGQLEIQLTDPAQLTHD